MTDDKQKKIKVLVFCQTTFKRFLKIRGNPHEIALGFALGLFVGMTPLLGIHTAIAVFFASCLKWNKISAAAAVWISNPLTAPVIYGINYFIGAKIMCTKILFDSNEQAKTTFMDLLYGSPEIFIAMTVGGIVTGILLAVSGYYFAFSAVSKYQNDIKLKLAQKKRIITPMKE